jgi:hypothetical protein
VVRKIVHLRWNQRLGPVAIADRVGDAPSAVHQVLRRRRINRLGHPDRLTGQPVRRYEHPAPGDLLHVDVKKLGNIPTTADGGSMVALKGQRNRASTPGTTRTAHRKPKLGHAFVHTVLDDHSRSRLRRISRLMVEGLRPNLAAMARTPSPAVRWSPMAMRSSSDRNRLEISTVGTIGT